MTSRALKAAYRVGGTVHRVDVRLEGGVLSGTVDDAEASAAVASDGPGALALTIGDRRVKALVLRRGGTVVVAVGGSTYELAHASGPEADGGAPPSEPYAEAPMTGVVAKVHVKAGDAVVKGMPLFAVEAMKMEYVVRADRDVVVSGVRRRAGDRVAIGEPVVDFGPAS